MNNNYYQSDIKTSRQEDSIYVMRYASQQMLIDKLKKQLEAYENMRKEAIEYIHDKLDRFDCDGNLSISMQISYCEEDLLNILNKVGEDNETI